MTDPDNANANAPEELSEDQLNVVAGGVDHDGGLQENL